MPKSLIILFALLPSFFNKGYGQDSLARKINKLDRAENNNSHKPDSAQHKVQSKLDSAYHYQNKKLDSLQKNFHHRTDSVQRAYAAAVKELHSGISKLNHKKDSLNRLKLPAASVTHKIDSLERAQTKKINELNGGVAKIKKETLSKVSVLHLPPRAQNEINAFTKNINGFSVPKNFFLSKSFGVQGMNLKLPGIGGSLFPTNLGIPSASLASLEKLNLNGMAKLPSLSQLEGSLGTDLSKIKSMQNAANAKALEKDVMNVASQNSEIKGLVKEQNQVTNMEKELGALKDPKKADSLAMTQLKPAVNHFLGKEKKLQGAMGQVSKLKQKYSDVKSLSELPKRAPNPLKNKPWVERVVPGLNYFVQSKHYTLIDFNPYVGWRFNSKVTASLGWNERTGVSNGTVATNMNDRLFGVRATVSYLWQHGIVATASPEVMWAYVPTSGNVDVKQQAALWGIYAGVRKNFPIYKKVNGYSEVLYHFSQKPGENIYGDRVAFRFGIEVKMKKKAKKK